MKIVKNNCFGGFGLSDKAYERLIELGVPLFDNYEEQKEFEKNNSKCDVYIIKFDDDFCGKYYSNFNDYGKRINPLLTQVVEELGEIADGRFAKLEVVEIPDNIEYEFDDYDGVETIHEAHRSW